MKNLRNLFRLLLCLLLLIPATVSAENKLALEPFTISAGQTQDLVIDLINDTEITAVEFILTLPEGLTIQPDPEDAEFLNVSLASNRTTAKKHSLDAEVNANGYKVLLASNKNYAISGNSGALIKIGIVAASTFKTGTITVQNIELVSPNETAMHPDPVSVEITLPKVTVTINNAERKYGEDNPQFTFSSSATSDLSSVITLSCDATKTSNVGQYAITGTSTATDFDVEFVNGTLTVNPAVLTVTANAKTKVYGAADPELTYVATGLVNGDQLSGALTRATGDAVGIYAIQVGTLAASTNYSLSFTGADFTITAKAVSSPTITLAESSVVYDGTEKQPAVTVKDGSTEISASEYTVSYSNNINVGTATVTITDNAGGNYTVSGSKTFTITAKSVTAPTITLAESSVVYDGTEKQPAVTVLDGTTTIPASEYTVGYSNNKNVGTATVTITSNAGGNYTVSGSTTFTITKAPLTVKAKDAVRLVGNANPTFEIEYQGFVSGETDAVLTTKPVASTTATADSPVGVYDIIVTGGSAANYELSYVKGKLTVADKSSITITAENVSRLYGEANPQFRYTVVGGDGMQGTPELTCEAVPGSPVGTYIIKVNKGSITTDANFIFNDGILTVNRAQLTAISNATRTYGEDNPALTISYTGFVNGETEAVLKTAPTASTTATKSSGAGFYPITVTGGEADNYNIICQNGQLTVNKAALHVYVADVTRTYGEQNPQFTCRYDGFVNGDSQSAVKTAPSLSTEATASSPAGTYSITATGGVADNYDFISVDGWLNVKKAPLTITADDATRNEGADEPEFTYTCSGLVNGDQADNALTTKPTLTTNARKDSPAGTYTITAANAVAPNYDISYVAGTLTVVKLENFVEEKTGATYNVEVGNQVSFAGVSETTETPTTCQVPATVTYEGNTYDVKSIADRAFMGNTVIEEITLPASIERIGASVFAGCTSLRQLVVNILTPLALPTAHARALTAGAVGTVFEGVDLETCVLYVPESSVDLYKAADGWKEFKTILPITSLGIQGYTTTAGQLGDVYDLGGRKVRTAATSLDGLPKGVYIVGGRKVTK